MEDFTYFPYANSIQDYDLGELISRHTMLRNGLLLVIIMEAFLLFFLFIFSVRNKSEKNLPWSLSTCPKLFSEKKKKGTHMEPFSDIWATCLLVFSKHFFNCNLIWHSCLLELFCQDKENHFISLFRLLISKLFCHVVRIHVGYLVLELYNKPVF